MTTTTPSPAASLTDTLPLTSLQAGMLFQHRLDPEGGYDLEQLVMQLHEALDVEAFVAAFRHVVGRHPALRTTIGSDADDHAVQRVQADAALPVVVDDWLGAGDALSEDDVADRLRTFLRADRRRGFDLEQAPPLRLFVARVADDHVVAVWSFHHIILDGRSFAIVLRDVFLAYDAIRAGADPTTTLPPAPRPFADFVRWVNAQPTAPHLPFWKELLAGKDAPTPLPPLRPVVLNAATTSSAPAGYGELSLTVATKTTKALRKLASTSKSTLGTVVSGAWALTLNRLTGDDDVVFGTTRACRRSALDNEGADDMVGLFINTLPVRAKIVDDEPLTAFLSSLRAQNVAVREHEHTPLVDVLGQSGVPRGTPLFHTLLMFENQELNQTLRSSSPAFAARHFHYEEQPTFPLNVTVFDHGVVDGVDTLEVRVLFDSGRWADVGIEKLLTWFETVLASMTTAKTTGDVRLLPDDERIAVLFDDANDTAKPFNDQLLLHELFEARVDDARATHTRPLAIISADAVDDPRDEHGVGGDRSLDVIALEERANQLAWHLREQGAVRGSYVGILLERGLDLVVALLAVSKAGAAYVPLDPDYPEDRLAFMLQDTKAPVVITQRALQRLLPADAKAVVVDDPHTEATLADGNSARPPRINDATDVCYTIYTSGSTGVPKGVVLTHEAVINTLVWVNREFGFTPADRLLFVTSVCFDLSVFDVFGALGAGASIRIATSAELKDPEALVARLTSGEITVWDSAPAALHRLVSFFPGDPVDEVDAGRRRRLRLVMLSGDWIPVSLPAHLRHTFHRGLLVKSLGGATEAAIWSNYYHINDVPPTWTSIPYGRPIDNAFYHVLDRRLQPVPPGVSGDLYIGGTCLASGYLHREALTAERFIPDPFAAEAKKLKRARPGHGTLYKTGDLARYYDDDGALHGELEFLGRADFQVKIRGFRVELGEVDAVVGRCAGVRDALSVARVDASNQKVLVTYVVPHKGVVVTPQQVKDHTAATLPEFMVPSHVVVLEQGLPVSVNGKVDRKALPDPLTATATKIRRAPSTATEQALLPIWQGVLGTELLSVDDSFFDKGGHSLLATLLVGRIKQQLGVEVRLSKLFAANTIEKLARSIDEQRAPASVLPTVTPAGNAERPQTGPVDDDTSALVTLRATGSKTPVFFIAGIGGHVFTFQKLAELLGPDTPAYGFRAIGGEAGEVPKERVEDIATAYLKELDDKGLSGKPIVLCGYSFGGYVAYELALRLQARGVPPELLVFFDVLAPGYPRRLPAHERVRLHAETFMKKDLDGKRQYLGERLNNVRRRVYMKLGLAERLAGADDVGAAVFDEQRQQEMRALWGALATAQMQYRPQRTTTIPGLLIKAATTFDWPATRFDDPAHGWRDWLKSNVSVVTVDGAHLQLFEGDNPATMARAIGSARR
ncbi:MAG TPA: amino acid adenylation domain-containing protein [Myxococcota bacterium]